MNERNTIIETIYRFANSLDLKDWEMLRACFTEMILTDYSDLRGDPPALISADEYVAKRIAALTALKTQHLSSNHVISVENNSATCHSQMLIYRRKGDLYFNTHCYYEHILERINVGWKITGIKQKVWWSEGDSQIHSGTK